MADLDNLLAQQEWQAADQVTQALLLQSVQQTQESYLSPLALAQIPCSLLHQLNYRWQSASQGLVWLCQATGHLYQQRPI